MAKIKKTVYILLLIIFIAVISSVIFTDKSNKKVEIFIPKGSSPAKIAKILKENEVIYSTKIFLGITKIFGYSKHMQAGLYDFNTSDSLFRVINKLKNGENKNIKVTFPEGFTSEQMAQTLQEHDICDKEKFINLAKEKNLEGYLFPNTYFFPPQTDEKDIIKTLSGEFNKFWTAEKEQRAAQMKITKKDIIILASIVEKEAVSDEERPIIAGVFLNRLTKKMRLESCATVLYAMGITKERLTFEDLKFESPYNTYRHSGLPPGPICNPGAKAINAVLYPAATNSLYFVSKGNGTHFFSSTLEEHIKNKTVSKKKVKK